MDQWQQHHLRDADPQACPSPAEPETLMDGAQPIYVLTGILGDSSAAFENHWYRKYYHTYFIDDTINAKCGLIIGQIHD